MRIRRWNRLPTQTRFAVVFITGVFLVLFVSVVALVN
jgi:hypothetical protein